MHTGLAQMQILSQISSSNLITFFFTLCGCLYCQMLDMQQGQSLNAGTIRNHKLYTITFFHHKQSISVLPQAFLTMTIVQSNLVCKRASKTS